MAKQKRYNTKFKLQAANLILRAMGVYGHRKVHADLASQGISCCRETVRRVLSGLGLFSQAKRKFVVTTDSNHCRPIAENLLARDCTATAPNQKWLT